MRSAESSSQSTIIKSVLRSASCSNALEELKQTSVVIDRFSRSLLMMQTTLGSREISKHSNAISEVMATSPPGNPALQLNHYWPVLVHSLLVTPTLARFPAL